MIVWQDHLIRENLAEDKWKIRGQKRARGRARKT